MSPFKFKWIVKAIVCQHANFHQFDMLRFHFQCKYVNMRSATCNFLSIQWTINSHSKEIKCQKRLIWNFGINAFLLMLWSFTLIIFLNYCLQAIKWQTIQFPFQHTVYNDKRLRNVKITVTSNVTYFEPRWKGPISWKPL